MSRLENAGVSREIREHFNEVVELRRRLHQHPEPGFKEERTAALIRAKLRGWGIPFRPLCGTGTVALLEGARPGPTILIRADMDGLPIREETGVPYASKVPGMMHACGHDGHVAMALMAAKLLRKRRASMRGNVKLMFQPAEEGPGGARPMVEAGVLERPAVDAAFAIHLRNDLGIGKVGVSDGPVYASSDDFRITVTGKGGHAGRPHRAVDPVVAAAQIISASQNIVSRQVDPTNGAVVTFGTLQGGTKANIIPDRVEMQGTIRTFGEKVRRQVARDLARIGKNVAAALRAKMDFEYRPRYPSVVNDPALAERVRTVLRGALGARALVHQGRSMAGEDMAFVLREVPGVYLFVGSMNRDKGLDQPHHCARYNFDEAALGVGVQVWLSLAGAFLNGPA
ncbi:MAG TPA: amidohydrolase [Planctomycetota bacterium]|nr:amidohydrolase [Planctomycetota bacterium]